MDTSVSCTATLFFFFLFLLLSPLQHGDAAVDYGQALTKSILYFEAQRSGKLPTSQRVDFRADSALKDGSDSNVDLVGGYYDAGDNVKFGFPMAFTITTLAWGVVDFGSKLSAKGELSNALDAVRWGTDYLMKASATEGVLYAEVGDGDSDHACWQRPEDMTTSRTSYKIDGSNPGSDLAGEASAALAAASIAFRSSDPAYSGQLLARARKLFDFGRNSQGVYSSSIPIVQKYYSSSGYKDELQWAAVWLFRATGEETFLDYLSSSGDTGGVRSLFSWDDKYLGVQTLVAKLMSEGPTLEGGVWAQYKDGADKFFCNFIQKGNNNVKLSSGGMAWWQPWNNLQYTTSALLALLSYADSLTASHISLSCPTVTVNPDQLVNFAHSQVDYILGVNPKNMSYMIDFGSSYPQMVHHRGASIVSIKKDPTPVDCKGGYDLWFNKNWPNPNVLVGAIVGGPDDNDGYTDSRSNFQQAEPATVNTAPFVGVLARLA